MLPTQERVLFCYGICRYVTSDFRGICRILLVCSVGGWWGAVGAKCWHIINTQAIKLMQYLRAIFHKLKLLNQIFKVKITFFPWKKYTAWVTILHIFQIGVLFVVIHIMSINSPRSHWTNWNEDRVTKYVTDVAMFPDVVARCHALNHRCVESKALSVFVTTRNIQVIVQACVSY